MDFPIHIYTISMDLSILYFKGTQVEIVKFQYIFFPEDFFHLNWQTLQTLLRTSGPSLFAEVSVY